MPRFIWNQWASKKYTFMTVWIIGFCNICYLLWWLGVVWDQLSQKHVSLNDLSWNWLKEKCIRDLEGGKGSSSRVYTGKMGWDSSTVVAHSMHIVTDLLGHLGGVGQYPGLSSCSSIEANFQASVLELECPKISWHSRECMHSLLMLKT